MDKHDANRSVYPALSLWRTRWKYRKLWRDILSVAIDTKAFVKTPNNYVLPQWCCQLGTFSRSSPRFFHHYMRHRASAIQKPLYGDDFKQRKWKQLYRATISFICVFIFQRLLEFQTNSCETGEQKFKFNAYNVTHSMKSKIVYTLLFSLLSVLSSGWKFNSTEATKDLNVDGWLLKFINEKQNSEKIIYSFEIE